MVLVLASSYRYSKEVLSMRLGLIGCAALVVAMATSMFGVVETVQAANKEFAVVMPVTGSRGVSEDVKGALSDLLTSALQKTGRISIITLDDINAQLGRSQAQDVLGCDDVACAAEIGGALGTRMLISGKVRKIKRQLMLSLSLIDTETQETQRASTRFDNDPVFYSSLVTSAVEKLLGIKIKQKRIATQGSFGAGLEVIEIPEISGGDVMIDVSGGLAGIDLDFLKLLQKPSVPTRMSRLLCLIRPVPGTKYRPIAAATRP
jgi:hypothetical protein